MFRLLKVVYAYSSFDEVERIGIDDGEDGEGPRRADHVQHRRKHESHQQVEPEVGHDGHRDSLTPGSRWRRQEPKQTQAGVTRHKLTCSERGGGDFKNMLCHGQEGQGLLTRTFSDTAADEIA